jgi:hypothetical protein
MWQQVRHKHIESTNKSIGRAICSQWIAEHKLLEEFAKVGPVLVRGGKRRFHRGDSIFIIKGIVSLFQTPDVV